MPVAMQVAPTVVPDLDSPGYQPASGRWHRRTIGRLAPRLTARSTRRWHTQPRRGSAGRCSARTPQRHTSGAPSSNSPHMHNTP
eukprot:250757-Chlamydomonas_euryale.AAC.5